MKVIITGGTGLIGRALVESLSADGHEVIVLSRHPREKDPALPRVRTERWDARTAAGWGHLADGADAIVNLAGASIAGGLWTEAHKRRILDSRLRAGEAVLQAVQEASHRPRVLVQSSGIGYYGFRGDEELTEEDGPGDDFLARVAVAWEAVTQPVEELGLRRVVIRTAGVLSRRGGFLPPMMWPLRLFVGGPLGSGRQWLPWIHIADEVGAIRFLLENEQAAGPYNLAAPHQTTSAEFGRILARTMGRPFYMPAPAFMLRLVLGEMSSLLLEGQRAVPRRLLEQGFTFRFPEAEQALRDVLGRRSAPQK